MEVQVRHALTRLLADVGDHAVALDAHFFCHLGDDLKDMRDHGAVLGVDAGDGRDMRLGDHKEVRGSLRRVKKCPAYYSGVFLFRNFFTSLNRFSPSFLPI